MVNKFTDADEIAKFSSFYEDWWKNDGAFGMLHKLTPVRMLFIRQALSNFWNAILNFRKLLQVCGF